MNATTLILLAVGGYLAYSYLIAPAGATPIPGTGTGTPLSVPYIIAHAPVGLTMDQLTVWLTAVPAWRLLYVGNQTGISDAQVAEGAYYVVHHLSEFGATYAFAG
jgi:hypothetical protein